MTDRERRDLAREMVATLPRWGQWATGFRDFETPWGKVGFRQLAILWALRYELIPADDFTPGRIARLHEVQPSVVTRALARLEAGGFIERRRSPSDGRSYHVAMTDAGRQLSEYVERLYVDDIVSCFGDLDDTRIAQLRRDVAFLNEVVEDLDARRRSRNSTGGDAQTAAASE